MNLESSTSLTLHPYNKAKFEYIIKDLAQEK